MAEAHWTRSVAERVRDDFDRIATLTGKAPNSNHVHFKYLLSQLPPRIDSALEVGSGTGGFTRLLAMRSRHVLAIDLSPKMIQLAQQQSAAEDNIEYRQLDVMEWEIPENRFDAIVSIATLHHLPDTIIAKLAHALRPGGTLVVLDLCRDDGVVDRLQSLLGVLINPLVRWWHLGRPREPAELRRAWQSHGKTDHYPSLREVQSIAAVSLPGARIRKHLLWRYSLVWQKPNDAGT